MSMSLSGVEALPSRDLLSSPVGEAMDAAIINAGPSRAADATTVRAYQARPRRTPRKSLIVVLPENHVVTPELVTQHLTSDAGDEEVDVILACAGRPSSIAALHRKVRDVQVFLAPAGTTSEELRELAFAQASGDIVTLLRGTPV